MSYVIRRSQNLKHRRTFTTDDIREIARECYLPSSMEQVDNLIRWIGDTHPNPGETISINVLKHRAIAGSITDFGLTFILKCMIEMKFADGTLLPYTVKTSNGNRIIKEGSGNIILSLKGWDRFEELRRGGASGNAAFMAMKFGDQELDIILNNHFRNAVQRTGFQLKRLDDNPKAGLIDDKLRVEIKACRFLIADLTHSNLGAYWEAGFAEGLGKPVIYTCKESVFNGPDPQTRPHFDTNHHLTVFWDPAKPEEAAEKLKATIRATLPEAKQQD